jgi:AcrR family transcriptional regulator
MGEGNAATARTTDRTLTLLWRRTLGEPKGSRGPRQRVTVDEVVQAAVSLADAEGIVALSMRRVAERLGLGSMSLYTYVPGRSELIGLMIDDVLGEAPMPDHHGDLRRRLDGVARQLWEEYQRHPWLLDVETHRPWIGPNGSDRYEWQLAAIEGTGLDDVEMDQTITLLVGFVGAAARSAVLAARTQEQSGMSDAQWWEINAPVLQRVMPPGRYPVSSRVGTTAGQTYNAIADPVRAFEFGLARTLDGIDLYVRSRADAAASGPAATPSRS